LRKRSGFYQPELVAVLEGWANPQIDGLLRRSPRCPVGRTGAA